MNSASNPNGLNTKTNGNPPPAPTGKKAKTKVHKVMSEFKEGTLKSGGSGKPVKSRAQAVAIALSEARKAKGG